MSFMNANELSAEHKVHVETVYRRLIAAAIIKRVAPRQFEILPRGKHCTKFKNENGKQVLYFDNDEVREFVVQLRRFKG